MTKIWLQNSMHTFNEIQETMQDILKYFIALTFNGIFEHVKCEHVKCVKITIFFLESMGLHGEIIQEIGVLSGTVFLKIKT